MLCEGREIQLLKNQTQTGTRQKERGSETSHHIFITWVKSKDSRDKV